jgi:hypothetical protein
VASCLNPTSTSQTAAAADASLSERQPEWARRRVLYGNDALYYFLRFHHHLFDRMLAARRCARDRNQPTSLFSRAVVEVKDAVRLLGGRWGLVWLGWLALAVGRCW